MTSTGNEERVRGIFNAESTIRFGIISGTVVVMLVIYNMIMTPIWALSLSFTTLQKEVTILKENHLKHIETDIANIRDDIKIINSRFDKQYEVSSDNNRLLKQLIGNK